MNKKVVIALERACQKLPWLTCNYLKIKQKMFLTVFLTKRYLHAIKTPRKVTMPEITKNNYKIVQKTFNPWKTHLGIDDREVPFSRRSLFYWCYSTCRIFKDSILLNIDCSLKRIYCIIAYNL